MRDLYSPERRTALVLTGTGADGAYHAGVLRALHEAGVKIDVVCGRGIGAVAAVLSAIDGASRLWDAKGLWSAGAVAQLYRWRWPVRTLFAAVSVMAIILISPLLLLALGLGAYLIGLLLGMAGLALGADLMSAYGRLLAAIFAPEALPTWLPRLMTLAAIVTVIVLLIGLLAARVRSAPRRRARAASGWALLGAPLDASRASRHFVNGVWDLLRGGANLKVPAHADLSRRYAELLTENLAQPGFSELLLTVHDLDARRDLVFGLVREPFRSALFPPASGTAARRAEAFDLGGVARDHLVDVLHAALTVSRMTSATLVRFGAETYWRGETHRLIDRPGALARLLEEAAAAGAEQVILVAAAAEPAGPHELPRPRPDPLGHLSEHRASVEAASVRDALEHVQHRFRGMYVIRPRHNPVGPFDLAGAYDERSDRDLPLSELTQRGYEDAYHAFIEPVLAAAGERIAHAAPPTAEFDAR